MKPALARAESKSIFGGQVFRRQRRPTSPVAQAIAWQFRCEGDFSSLIVLSFSGAQAPDDTWESKGLGGCRDLLGM